MDTENMAQNISICPSQLQKKELVGLLKQDPPQLVAVNLIQRLSNCGSQLIAKTLLLMQYFTVLIGLHLICMF